MHKASGQPLSVALSTLLIAGAIAAFAGPAALAQDTSHAAVASATLPHDLTPWGMFVTADAVVKAVMIGLGCASVATWTVWLAKTIELSTATRRAHVSLSGLLESRSLADGVRRVPASEGPAREMLTAAIAEFDQSADAPSLAGLRDRIASRLERIEAASNRSTARGIGILATIGATAPFVGLFGTVWGIMDSFIGISKAHATNLAIVAPGIAEALLATAFGLAAAIPAVVIYNVFSRAIAGYRLVLGDVSAVVLRLASRDLDWQDPRTPAKRGPAGIAEAAE